MYYFIIVYLLILSFIELTIKNKSLKKIILFYSVLILFILSAYNTWSPDLESYKEMFKNAKSVRLTYEPLFFKLSVILQKYNLEFNSLQIIYSLLTSIFFFLFLNKWSLFPQAIILNFFLIPFFPNVVQIRQYLAMVILFYGLTIYEESKKKGFFWFGISIVVHNSLIIMIPIYILMKIKLFKYVNRILMFSLILIIFIDIEIIKKIVSYLDLKYLVYLENIKILGTIYLFLPYFILNNLTQYHYKNFGIKNRRNDLIIKILIYSNYLFIPMYFIRDFIRLNQNFYILFLIYVYNNIISGKKIIEKFKLHLFYFLLTIIIFYWEFLLINNGKYLDVIIKTIESNSILN